MGAPKARTKKRICGPRCWIALPLARSYPKRIWSYWVGQIGNIRGIEAEECIGGSPDTQREFLDILASDLPRRPQDRHKRKPVVANDFALGYTYQDVLDADHEGKGTFSGVEETS